MNYLNQLLYDMRHQRLMTWVSIIGTALAIFLIMSFIMADSINYIEMSPESHRNRTMVGTCLHIQAINVQNDRSTMGLNPDVARQLYDNLEGVEKVSYVSSWDNAVDIGTPGQETFSGQSKSVDNNFWDLYDFKFIDGRPFNADECKAEIPGVIITRSVAMRAFGEDKVAGREIEINMSPFTVIGVVEDSSPLLPLTYAQVYSIFNIDGDSKDDPWFGNTSVRLLLDKSTDTDFIKQQVEGRYKQLESKANEAGYNLIYHNQPYNTEDFAAGLQGSNGTPDTRTHKAILIVVYSLLILIPAINLASMTRARLRHRVAEIGVRRAFGGRRSNIVTQLFAENLIITIVGGLIGLALSLLFMMFASQFLFSYGSKFETTLELLTVKPDLAMLFRWSNFFIAMGACLIMNILSATIPAWRASRIAPAVALSASK